MGSLKFNQSAFAIDAFRSNFINGARGYLFYVIPTFPSRASAGSLKPNPTYLVRSSTIPQRTVEAAPTNWQGYTYNLGGKSTFSDWSITYTVDKTCQLYNKYIEWTNLVHNPKTNVHGDPNDFMVDQAVQILSLDGKSSILDINIIGCWPTSVSELSLDYAGSDILTFTVTFKILRVEYPDIDGGNSLFGGNDITTIFQ